MMAGTRRYHIRAGWQGSGVFCGIVVFNPGKVWVLISPRRLPTCWTKLLDSGRIKLYCGRCAPSDRLEGTKVGERNEAISQAATRFHLSNLGRDEHAARTGTDKLSNEWKGIV